MGVQEPPSNTKERLVTNGPFANPEELVAGFWLWQVKSMEEAIEWVKRCPNPMLEESEIEIRPVFEAEDFGDALTPELKAQEARIRAQAVTLDPPRFENGHELLIAGINESYTFESRVNIPLQWNRFAPYLGKIPGQIGKAAYGVCWNYRAGSGFDYLSGVEVTNTKALPAEFSSVRIPAQYYAVFLHRQHVSSIAKTLETIWTKWLPNSGYTPVESPSFERYTEEFDARTGTGGMEIWVAIKQSPMGDDRL